MISDPEVAATQQLFMACGHDDIESARAAIEFGANVNGRVAFGNTPLIFIAMYRGSPALTNLLIDAGADPNLKNMMGRSPYFVACEAENWAVASFLESHRVQTALRDINGMSPDLSKRPTNARPAP